MADIIEKIGKYFADQEKQMRDMYVHAAVEAATRAPPMAPPPQLSEPPNTSDQGATSLLRRRLSQTKQRAATAAAEDTTKCVETHSKQPASCSSNGVFGLESVSPTSSGSIAPKTSVVKTKKKKKNKNKKTVSSQELEDRERAQQRAAEGLARAQERARRIQSERVAKERQLQLEREANAARLAEEMRKIEEIRRKGKQFAIRLRPHSAPTTPQSVRTPQPHEHGWPCQDVPVSARSDAPEHTQPNPVESTRPARSFLDEMEQQMRLQMLDEMKLNQQIDNKYSREEEEWARLQARIQKVTDGNAIKQERVNALAKTKENLEKEISENQAEAAALRHERHKLEEESKRLRLLRQREAEREIHARLRREESQRLVEEERAHSDHAAEARAKAKLRVQSRAALLKRVLHGCDIRSNTAATTNQDDEDRQRQPKALHTSMVVEASPELAEFEEDGLAMVDELPALIHPRASPKKTIRPPIVQAPMPGEPSFKWQVPALPIEEIHDILWAALDALYPTASTHISEDEI